MGNKKIFLIMLITLILITIGGAWASDDHAVDEVSAASDETVAVDSADDTQQDTSEIKENLTSQKNEETVQTVDSDSKKKGEILGANNDEDVLRDGTGNGGNFNQLSSLITETTGKVTLNGDYYKTAISDIIINKKITIVGTGNIVLDGKTYNGRLVTVNSNGNVTFENLTFTNGKGNSNQGGAIYISGSAYFKNCIFKSNKVSIKGGAVFLDNDASAEFINCTFENNNCTSTTNGNSNNNNYVAGGAIHAIGNNTILINNCIFKNNNANQYCGGVYIQSSSSATVINSYFESNGNKPKNAGYISALYFDKCSYATVDNCTFVNNTAATFPGTLIVAGYSGSSFYLKNSKFINNEALTGRGGAFAAYSAPTTTFIIDNCTFKNNNAKDLGGAISIRDSYALNVLNSKFINNSVETGFGGAIAVDFNTAKANVTNVFINNSYFEDNEASTYGGAVAIELNLLGTLKITNSNFTNNKVSSGGGAVHITSKNNDVTINQCNFTGNNATSGKGGAIYFQADMDNIEIKNSVFNNNKANNGGAIRFDATAGENPNFDTITITNSNFTNNKANTHGSAISATNAEHVNFDKCTFDSNVATGNGALYYVDCSDVNYNDCDFINNNASNGGASFYGTEYAADPSDAITYYDCTFDNNHATSGNGGAINAFANDVTINKCTFTNNDATEWAGAVILGDGTPTTIKANIINSRFINNNAKYAGAIDVFATVNVTINNCVFESNNATSWGGAVYATGINGTITNCNFTSNKGLQGSAISYYPPGSTTPTKAVISYCKFVNNNATDGGTVWFRSINGNINNCNFTDNTALRGGAIVVDIDHITIDKNTFIGNNATSGNGGAINIDNNATDIIVSNSKFINNTAKGNGGAIYDDGDTDQINNCNFTSNYANGDGGAIYLKCYGGQINYCNFTENKAAGKGGAVVFAHSDQHITQSNFIGNNATIGGAVYVSTQISSLTIDNSTFTKNKANDGGAVYCIDSSSTLPLKMSNDDFINNTAIYNGGAVYYKIGTTSYRDYNLFNNEGTKGSDGKVTWTHAATSIITTSFFEGNIDYYMNLTASVEGYTVTLTLTVSNRTNRTQTSITVYLNNGTDITPYTFYGNQLDNEHWTVGENYTVIQIVLTEQPISEYNATVQFNDNNHEVKEQTVNYTVVRTEFGDFELIQEMINEAIQNAVPGEVPTITLNRTYTYNEELDKGQINITAPIIINGINNAEINALGYCRIFDISGANVTINNVLFRNGKANGNKTGTANDTLHGGAILWTGSNGTLANSTFRQNTADYGGAVFIQGGNLDKIVNCEFSNNTATYNGGAIDWNASKGNLTDSRLFNNKAMYGGAVFVGADGGNSHIYNCNFTNNNATQRGGAVDWNASSGDIIKSKFENNRAQYGGAVFVGSESEEGKIIDSRFISNTATINGGAVDWNASKGNVSNSYFYMNTAGQNGGAIFVGANGTSGHILNSVFEANNATNGRGGAVDWYASAGDIEYSNFTDNHAQYGGAVFVGHEGYGGNITNSRFIKNTATVKGGAVDWNATSGSLRHSYFKENEADYGGALFVGSHSTSGSAFNNTYIANKATFNGGAIDLNTTGGYINGSRFYNNTAAEGGAVFVGSNTTSGHIVDSVFDGNNASANGGAVFWKGASGEIYNTNFNNNFANAGGAVYVGKVSVGGNITLSNFTNNKAISNGGAIYWDNSNGNVKDSYFESNNATNGGAITVKDSEIGGGIVNSTFVKNHAEDGSAVYLWNAVDVNILNSTFKENNATANAALYIRGVSNFLINDTKFNSNEANTAAIKVEEDSTGAIANSTFKDNNAEQYNAGLMILDSNVSVTDSIFNQNNCKSSTTDIFINADTGKLDNLTLTYNDDNSVSSIFIMGDVTLNDIKVNNWNSDSADVAAIKFDRGNSSLSNSTIDGNNAILIQNRAEVHLTNVNNTNAATGEYSVSNNGTLYLKGNKFSNVIINYGKIMTKTTTKVLNNDTIVIKIDEDASLNVSIVDDNNNTIIVPALKFTANTTNIIDVNRTDKTHHYGTYKQVGQGVYVISVNNDDLGLEDNAVENGTLKVKDPKATLKLNVTQDKQGEIVTIKAIINVTDGDDPTGNVTFTINGDAGYNNVTTEWIDATTLVATLTLNNLTPDTYFVTAVYNGDDTHFACQNDTHFIVHKRITNITVFVANIAYGQNATAIVTTNANGTVSLSLNGRKVLVIENGTATWNYTDLAPGNYTVYVDYAGNTYYDSASNSTNFTVYKYDMDVSVSETQFNQSATITVTLPSDVIEIPKVYLNGNEVALNSSENGVFTFVTDKLAVGNYIVNVTYAGDSKYYARDVNGTNFTVIADKDYKFNVTVTPQPVKYGENLTINITGPAGQNVTITIDGVNKTVTLDENGTYVETLNNLTEGTHTIVANVTGNENYTSKEITQTFRIDSANPLMTIEVTEPIAAGGPANVTVTVGKNATGNVAIYVNGTLKAIVPVEDGKAVMPIDTTVPGDYNVTAKFFSDDSNYVNSANTTGKLYTVDRYDSIITNTTEIAANNTVTVKVNVNATAGGNVTLTLNNGADDTVVTVDVVDGVATFDLGVLGQGDYTYTAVYNGDETFKPATIDDGKFTVDKLTNGTIEVTVEEAEFGDNATIIIKLPSDAAGNGDLIVKVNNTEIEYEDLGDGTYKVVTPAFPVGTYDINVTYTGDANYADLVNDTEKVTVESNSSYEFNVTVDEAPFGGVTNITVTAPAGVHNVTVYVDDVAYTVNITEDGTGVLRLDNITAGHHTVTANFTGNDNYTAKVAKKEFDIDQATPKMEIIVSEPIAPNSDVNVTVFVGKNATGKASITVDNVTTIVDVINGTATLTVKQMQPGVHNVTAEFFGDNNYTSAVNDTVKHFTVDKYNTTMAYDVEITPDNNVTVVVTLNNTATGNVTIELNGQTYNATVEDGVARVNLGIIDEQKEYAVNAVYNGDKNFNINSTEVKFNVTGLTNYTINVTVSESQFGDNTTITIKLPSDATTGNLTVKVNNTEIEAKPLGNGVYEVVTPAYPVGSYSINVTYTGDKKYANATNDTERVNVKANSSYEFNVTVDEAPFGGVTNITVTAPAGVHNVTVYVDDVPYTVNITEDGTGVLRLDNITAGHHTVTANFTGNDNYTAKVVNEEFDIDPAAPVMTIDVTQPIEAAAPANVTVTVGKNATGKVLIYINGTLAGAVEVDADGKAVLPIDTTVPGTYNVTAEFVSGDANYQPAANTTGKVYEVLRYDSVITNTTEIAANNSVTVKVFVNETAKGNVTITLSNGQTKTVDVVDVVATFDLGVLGQGDYTYTAVYNGDETFKPADITGGFSVEKLENATIKVEVTPGEFGDNTTIKVTVPADGNGNVTIYVDGVPTVVVPDENGVAIINVTPGVGAHEINVTYTNDTRYGDKELNGTKFTVEPDSHYGFNVTVNPAPFGNNTNITVSGPAGLKVNVTVDDEVYELTIGDDGTVDLVLDNLTAGKHDVTVTTPGNENYTQTSNSTSFVIPKQAPKMNVTISDNRVPDENVTVTVEIGDNATGFVNVVVDGKVYDTVEVKEGVAQLNITGLKPNEHTIEVKYLGDDNYNASDVVSREITMDKYDTTMDCTVSISEDNNVTVTVKLNETVTDGTVTITLDNGTQYSAPVKNGVATVELGVINEQRRYDFTAELAGSVYFNDNSAEGNFTVEKLENTTIKVEVTPGEYGDNTTIKVTVPADGDGNVTIYVDGVPTVVPVKDGVAVLNVTPGVGAHEINVTYTNDTKYGDKELNGTKFTVAPDSHYDFNVTVTPSDINYGDEVTITVSAPSGVNEVNVTIDGVTVPVTIGSDGKGEYKLNNLSAGDHTVIASFNGNENYTSINNSTSFTIDKAEPVMSVEVDETSDAGSDVVVKVTLDKNATGYVNITVDGEEHFVKVTDGEAVFTVENAQPGEHNVTVTYTGDANYTGASEDKSFNVDKYPSTMEIREVERDENNDVILGVYVNGTGNVTVKIGDKTYNATVYDGIANVNIGNVPVGPVEVNVTYSGDENFASATLINKTIPAPYIVSYELAVEVENITYGENATVKVTLPEDWAGDLVMLGIMVDGDYVNRSDYNLEGNVVTVTIVNPKAGEHPVSVSYMDRKYDMLINETSFTVGKATIEKSDITVNDPIEVGQPLNITVDLPEDANGTITVNVNGTKYVFDVVNGSANISIPNLGNGTYNVNVTYSGNDNYNSTSIVKDVVVNKVDPEITANTTEIKLGEPAIIDVTLPDDATGTVTIKVGEVEKTVPIAGGLNHISVEDIPVGENQTVIVTYNGNDKYAKDIYETSLTVKAKDTTSDEFKVEDKGNGTIIVTVPEGATGKVNITIGDETYEANITDGKAVIDIANKTNATPGIHDIKVTYPGDENNTAVEFNSTANVPKWESEVNVTIPTIREGDVAKVNVTVTSPEGRGYTPNGTVRVEVDGKGYYGELVNGNVIIDVPGLGNGTHTVKVTYDGNDYYLPDNASETVKVQEPITVKVNGTGNSSEIIVKLPNGTSRDQVEVLIDGIPTDNFDIGENGTAKVNLTGITPGEHNVTIKYTDEDGTVSYVNTTINVPKWSSAVNATAATIREGDPAIIKVKVSPDMQGEVKVEINGTGYIATVDENGEATIKAYGLGEGTHTGIVTYLGSDKYDPSNNTVEVTVQAPITVEVNGTGNSSEIIVKLPENATKDQVEVLIDGKDANDRVTVENGTAKVNLTGIEPGEHNVTIKYTDEDGTVSWVNTTVNVPKWSSAVNATAAKIREGDPAIIKVKVDPDMTGEVKVEINGTGYIATVDENGEATIIARGLGEGTHTGVVTYLGDKRYDPSNSTFTVTVQAPITVEVNGTGNGSEVIVKFPEGTTTEQVEVFIDGNPTDNFTIADDGTAKVNLTGITPGEHNVTIKYTDEDGTVSWVNTTVTVPKWSSAVEANASTIREGDPAIIKVKVSPDMQGEVKVEINGTGYIATVDENGEATIIARGLGEGTHTGIVTYLGSDKYDPSNTTVEVTVQAPITVEVNGTGNGSEVVVKLPEGTTKDQVNVTIDGKDANDRVTVENGTAKVNLTGIEPGEHNITIKYTAEDGTVSWVNTTINVPRWSSAVNASAKTIREGDVCVINVEMDANETGRVLVNINGTGYYADLKDGKAVINAPGLKAGTYNATVSYEGDKKYDPSNNTFQIVVQAPITIDINGTGNSSEIVVQLPEGATDKDVNVTIDGNTTLPVTVDKNGTARVNLTGIEPGEHNITVKYVDPDGTVSYVNTTINVPRWSSAVNASAKTIREGDVCVINVEMDANETGRVLVNINGTGYYADLSDGKAVINAPGLKAGTYNATVSYEGDKKYDPSNNTFQIVVQAPITIDVNGTGNSSEIVVQLPEGATDKDVTITVDGNKTLPVSVDENGTARANLTGLEPGEHNVTVKYVDPDGTVSYVNTTIDVPRWTSVVNATAATIREGDDAKIIVKVDSDETGTVYVDIAGTGYYGTLENGEVTIIAPGIKKGTYTGNVTYLGDKKYDPSNNTFTLEVQAEITVDVDGAGSSSELVIQLPENNTDSNLTVIVDGVPRNATINENGTATVDLSDLPAGDHNVTVIYTDKDGTQSVVNKTVKVYESIKAADEIKRGWNSPYDAEAEFLDKEGHVLANTTVQFIVNGKTYNVKTDEKGIGKLTTSHLAVGKYEATIVNPVTGEEIKRNVTIVKRLIENKDVTCDYYSGKYYVVRAIGDDGEPVGAGEVVGISTNGVGYVVKTNKDGYARLKINLLPKKYNVVSEYAKYKVTNKVVVKQTLKLVKKTVKVKKGKKLVLKAKLKWTNGKAIKGKKIVFKFKGKTYKAKTNKKGIAKVTIKAKVTKKLKKGKKYKYTATYVKNKVKGKVKVKK